MQELKQKILEFVQENGPVLPVQISKAINGNTIFAGAFLSELVAHKKVKITSAKVGGSPMYYVEGQEEKLQVLRDHLSQRPSLAFDLLKEKNILRDKLCEPWERVALREIKDFAFPLNVNIKGNVEVFWKWYLLPDQEAREIIMGMIGGELGVKEESPEEEKFEEPEEEPEEEMAEWVKEEPKGDVQEVKEHKSVVEEAKEKIEKVAKKFKKKEEQTSVGSFKFLEGQGEFYDDVIRYFTEKDIQVLKQNIVTKNRFMNFMVQVPSPLGRLKYYVIARNKKKLNDADLSLAYSQGQDHKLPVIVLGTGEITKKAEKYIEENIKGLVFRRL